MAWSGQAEGKTEGRVYFPIPDAQRNGVGSCRLQINLLAVPPSGDILLVGSANPCRGTFTGLAEGATVRAEFDGKAYEWKLTYCGGRNGCDIMLRDPRVAAAGGKMAPYVTGKQAKLFRFDRAIVEAAYRELYRQSDAQASRIGGCPLAFPGAEGYGAYARGGRGGKVLFVTNLSDSGPGSLREALEAKGPRTVVFRVGGLIETKGLVVREPYLTLAGQTAPGDGICIKKTESSGDALALSGTHDVIIRFLRIRAGNNTGQYRCDAFRVYDSDNFIVDHCSCNVRKGASTTQRPPYFIIDPKVALPASLYLSGNIMAEVADVCRDNWKGVQADRWLQSPTPFPAPPVETQPAEEALELVLKKAGATLPRRDSVDDRTVSEVRDGVGRIINSEKEVGGWPDYAPGEPPVCTANDGIPDAWKQAHGLSLTDPKVANAVNADGHTELELYLNSLVR